MSSELEQRIGATMADRAATIDGISFTAGEILATGRRTRARNRRIGVAAAATCVAAIVAVSASFTSLGHQGLPPATPGLTTMLPSTPPTATVTPTEALPTFTPLRPTTGISPASIKLNYAMGSQLTPWNGEPVTVALPPGWRVSDGVRVPGGWVLEVQTYREGEGFSLWWQPDSGEARDLGIPFPSWAVSGDGSTLVIAATNQELTAYRLPSLTKVRSATFAIQTAVMVVGVAGDWALLKQVSGDGSPTVAAAWNLRTNKLTYTPEEVYLWGLSDDGRVLRTINAPDTSCVDLVPIAALADLVPTGLCSDEITTLSPMYTNGFGYVYGSLSPDGSRVVLVRHEKPTVFLRTADIRAGRWRPAPAGADQFGPWDTDTTYLTRKEDAVLRCTVTAVCTPIALPDLGAALIPNRGT